MIGVVVRTVQVRAWPKAPAPISHWRPSGRMQIWMSSGRSSQSEKGTRGSCTPSAAPPPPSPVSPLEARLSRSLLAPALHRAPRHLVTRQPYDSP